MAEICEHCGTKGQRVQACDSFKAPHLCPNDHIDHARPDLFCKKCGALMVVTPTASACLDCTGLLKSPEYLKYKKQIVEIGVEPSSEEYRIVWEQGDYPEAFLEKTSPEDEVDSQMSYWEE